MEKVLECPICTEIFDRSHKVPLVLLCGHTICKECITQMHSETGHLVCPLDDKADMRRLDSISHSYHILDLVEHVSSMIQTIKYLKLSPQERREAMLKQAKTNIEALKEHLSLIRAQVSEVRNKKAAVKFDIESAFSFLKTILQERVTELSGNISQVTDSYLQEFSEAEINTSQRLEDTLQSYEHIEQSGNFHEVQPLEPLPDLPPGQIRLKLVYNPEQNLQFVNSIGRVSRWSFKVPHECQNFKNITYWMVPPCCSQHYCCNKCHDTHEDHPWAFADKMVCMYCETEQPYKKLPNTCIHCKTSHKGVTSKPRF